MLNVFVGFLHFETVEVIFAHDDVIVERDVHQCAGSPELIGEGDVPLTGTRQSGRMVVQDDDRCGIVEQGVTQDNLAVDGRAAQCAHRDLLLADKGTMVGKIDEPGLFVIQTIEVIVKKLFGCAMGEDIARFSSGSF